jgi:hypothetical protein
MHPLHQRCEKLLFIAPKAHTFSRGEGAEGSEATEAEVECGKKLGLNDTVSDLEIGQLQ